MGVVVIVSVAVPNPLTVSVGETGDKVTCKVPVIVEVAIIEGIIEFGVSDGTAVFPGLVPGLGVFVAGIDVIAGVFVAGIGVIAGVFVGVGIVGMDCKSGFAQVVPAGIKTRIEIRIIAGPKIFHNCGDFINSSYQENGKLSDYNYNIRLALADQKSAMM